MIKLMIDGAKIEYHNQKEIVVDLFKMILVNSQYRSFENIRENIKKVFEFLFDALEDKKLIVRLRKSLKFFDVKTKEELLEKAYNTILSFEGMNSLTGFGMSNKFGDKLIGNPEKIRRK